MDVYEMEPQYISVHPSNHPSTSNLQTPTALCVQNFKFILTTARQAIVWHG